jgi:mevalonate kinase
MTKEVLVSAPAKVHIIGEHAVVYGYPAILATVNKRIYIKAKKSDKVIFTDDRFNNFYEWEISECLKSYKLGKDLWEECLEKKDFSEIVTFSKRGHYLKALIGTCLKKMAINGGIEITITKSEIPSGSGLGSSAALAVAITKAISEVYEKDLSLHAINSIAFECEKLMHGNPSGADNSTSCFGGLIWFEKSQPIITLKEISKLENFMFVMTKKPEKSTGELVEIVRNLMKFQKEPKMKEIEKMTYEMKEVLAKKDYESMKKIINRTNELLSALGLATKETNKVYKEVLALNGASKMCGSGGGGIMLVYHEDPNLIKDKMKSLGFEVFEAELAVEGVMVEDAK